MRKRARCSTACSARRQTILHVHVYAGQEISGGRDNVVDTDVHVHACVHVEESNLYPGPPDNAPNRNAGDQPLPLRHNYHSAPLPSTEIPKYSLRPVEDVLQSFLGAKEDMELKVGTIAQRLARIHIWH